MKDIIIPPLGESVTEAIIAKWMKEKGDSVQEDDILLELETDKVTLEVNANATGVLADLQAKEGDTVSVGQVVGAINTDAVAQKVPDSSQPSAQATPSSQVTPPVPTQDSTKESNTDTQRVPLAPSVQRIVQEMNIDPQTVFGTGKGGRLTKGDVLTAATTSATAAPTQTGTQESATKEERIPLSTLRKTIAQRLKTAQNTAAILTTFNEVDMHHVMALRARFKDSFEKKHHVKLGLMSFFVKACVVALKEIPEMNAEMSDTDLIYKNHYDISVAIGTPRGLVVPVIKNADQKSFADIEIEIADLALRAQEGKLTFRDMASGTFSISNGGVYGSMLSTPILNPPQSGILGMHNIQKRPVVVNDNIDIRPIMYLALSYDHRIVDGQAAVTFLVRIKQRIEDPERILLDI